MEKKQFYRSVAALVLPMALQNLINVSVSTADVVMLGKVGETALSASSLAGQIYFVMTLIFFGLTSGATILIAQYWGKRRIDIIEEILGMSFRIGVLVALVFTIAVLGFPGKMMCIFTNDAAVIAEGVRYLRIIGFSYIISAMTMIYLNEIRGVEQVVISTVVYAVSLMVNIVCNAIFIFGMFGLPAMGIQGAALGTVIARIVEFIIMVLYDRKWNPIFHFQLKNVFTRNKELEQDFVKYAMPVLLNELAWGSGISMIAAIIGRMGQAAVAAHSVMTVGRQMSMILSFGIGGATAILVGKTIGEGKRDLAKIYAKRFIWLSIIFGALGTAVILIVIPIAGNLLSLSQEARNYLHYMTYIMSYFVFAQSINSTIVVGIFRAGGDSKIGLMIDLATLWGGSILFGALAAFVLKWPVIPVYVLLISDEVIKLPFVFKRYFSYKWLKDVTR